MSFREFNWKGKSIMKIKGFRNRKLKLNRTKVNKAFKIGGIFLILVIAGTFVSRLSMSMLTPIVECERPKSDSLEYAYVKDAVIEGTDSIPVYVCPGIGIDRLYTAEGENINKGDQILKFNIDDLNYKYQENVVLIKDLKTNRSYSYGESKKMYDMQIATVEKQQEELKEYIDNDGIKYCDTDGMVTYISQNVGSDTTDEAIVLISPKQDSYTVKVNVTVEDAKKIAEGDSVIVSSGEEKKETVKVENVVKDVNNGDLYNVCFTVSGDTFEIGNNIQVIIRHLTEKYDTVVPLSAIRNDGNQSYVLVVTEQDTLLGTELVAKKVYVKLGENNSEYAVVVGSSLSSQDKVIVGSNKNVESNDVVRER